jgi:putative CocE/NonD family hydrolase
VDPYELGQPLSLKQRAVIDAVWQAVPFLNASVRDGGNDELIHKVRYYTYVERQWKETNVWPPPGFERQRWYFAPHHQLSRQAPTELKGEDTYTVDFDATTGLENRWFSGLSGVPVRYLDRAAQDEKLLLYETPEMTEDVELTGHPVVSLQVSSTEPDGAFIVYVEDIFPEGRVVYLTEGELRAVQRRVSSETPPVAEFGPYHTFRRDDALPLVPDEVAEITFDLLPISTIIRAGHRIRVALAGHDKDTFTRYPADGIPTLRLQRNAVRSSWIDLPLLPRGNLGELPTELPVSGLLCPAASVSIALAPLVASRRRW